MSKYKSLLIDVVIKLPEDSELDISPANLRGTLNDILQPVIQNRLPLFEISIDKIYVGEQDYTLAEKIYLLKEDIDED